MLKNPKDLGSIRFPQVAPHLRWNIQRIDPTHQSEAMMISSGYDPRFMQLFPCNQQVKHLMEAMDGTKTINTIIDELSNQYGYDEKSCMAIYRALCQGDIIISAEHNMTDSQAALWLNMEMTPSYVEQALKKYQLNLVNLTGDSSYEVIINESLSDLGFNVVSDLKSGVTTSLTLVIVNDYLQDKLGPLNTTYREQGHLWMPINLSGNRHVAGPVFNTATHLRSFSSNQKQKRPKHFCWNCMATRIYNNRQIENAEKIEFGKTYPAAEPMPSFLLRPSSHNIAIELAKFILLLKDPKQLYSKAKLAFNMLVLDKVPNENSWHYIGQLPQCKVCGDKALNSPDREPQPIIINDPEPGFNYMSCGWRTCSPEKTFSNYEHLYSPYTGVTDRLEKIGSDESDFIHVYESGNNIAMRSGHFFLSVASVKMFNAGKGSSDISAKNGALCESIERYCTSFQGTEIRKSATFQDFEPGKALMPNVFQHYSPTQLRLRDEVNAKKGLSNAFTNIPADLGVDEVCDWSPIWSVEQKESIWVPTQMLYFGYPYNNQWIAAPDTNGVATGNTMTDAFIQAFLEALERDLIAIWWYNQLRCSEVDLTTIDNSLIHRVIEQQQQQGRYCWMLDISFDLNVNVFVFLSAKINAAEGSHEVCFGASAHFDPEIAAVRALCEHNQLWYMIQRRREGNDFKELATEFANWLKNVRVDDEAFFFLVPAESKPLHWDHYQRNYTQMNLVEQREALHKIVAQKQWQLYLADFTRPDIGLPVVRVLIPELRSMHSRLGPGRLFDVPVELGIFSEPKKEEDLNPTDPFV